VISAHKFLRKSGKIAASIIVTTSFGTYQMATAGPDLNDPMIFLDMFQDAIPATCRYTMDIQFEGAEVSSLQTLKYDPEHEQPWSLLAVDGVTVTPEEQAAYKAPAGLHPEGTGPVSVLLTADFVPANPTALAMKYLAEDLPRGSVIVSNSDISRHMRADLTIDRIGDADHTAIITISSKRSFRFKFFARVTDAVEIRRYTHLDNEWLIPTEVELTYSARLFGRSITERETRRYQDVECW